MNEILSWIDWNEPVYIFGEGHYSYTVCVCVELLLYPIHMFGSMTYIILGRSLRGNFHLLKIPGVEHSLTVFYLQGSLLLGTSWLPQEPVSKHCSQEEWWASSPSGTYLRFWMPGIARSLIVIVVACLRKVRTGNPTEGLNEETHLSSVAWPFSPVKD